MARQCAESYHTVTAHRHSTQAQNIAHRHSTQAQHMVTAHTPHRKHWEACGHA